MSEEEVNVKGGPFSLPEIDVLEEDLMLEDLPDVNQAVGGSLVSVEQEEKEALPIPAAHDPFNLLSKAMDAGLDTQTLEKFMDLQERHEANEARKAYAEAMAACQKEMQPIVASAENDHTQSYYAKLGTINRQITPIYGKHGFSISFGHGTAAVEGEIRTIARVLHRMGHFEDFHIDLPPDDKGSQGTVNKTAIHARASSNTYGRRYIVMGIFNLSILSEDDDGNASGGVGAGKISEEDAIKLEKMVDDAGLIHTAIKREFGIDEYAKLPAKKLNKAIQRIEVLAAKKRNLK